jgi:hypothetical protein
MNAELAVQGLVQTTKYSTDILQALDCEQKLVAEVIASQQSQERKLDLLFEELERLNLAAKAGVSEGSSRDASELVDKFAEELKIDRAEVREALEEMGGVGEELRGVFDALSSLNAQVICRIYMRCSSPLPISLTATALL